MVSWKRVRSQDVPSGPITHARRDGSAAMKTDVSAPALPGRASDLWISCPAILRSASRTRPVSAVAASTVRRSDVVAGSSTATSATVPSDPTCAATDRASVRRRTAVTSTPAPLSKTRDTRPTLVGLSKRTSIHWPTGRLKGALPHAVNTDWSNAA